MTYLTTRETSLQASALRDILNTVEETIHSVLYRDISSLTEDQVNAVIREHYDYTTTHPDLKENMNLIGISVGGDLNSITLEFTDVTLGVENWQVPIQSLYPNELINLVATIEKVKGE